MKVLCINCGGVFRNLAGGRYNEALHQHAVRVLQKIPGTEVRQTNVQEGYDVEREIEKFMWADLLIFQFPLWWMSAPGHAKEYLEDVLTRGEGTLWLTDNRSEGQLNTNGTDTVEQTSPIDPVSRDRIRQGWTYGTGCRMGGKYYMFSVTAYVAREVFNNKNDFFRGKYTLDDCLRDWHLSLEFCGIHQLPTFAAHGVSAITKPDFQADAQAYSKHLNAVVARLPVAGGALQRTRSPRFWL